MTGVEKRLTSLGIILPKPTTPVANYIPWMKSGSLVYISGQVSTDASGGIKGIVGEDVDLATAQEAARICGINLIAQMKQAAGGDLDRVAKIVKLGAFVQAGRDFFDIPQVVNGCSDLMVAAFADAGRHARSAVGVYRLPLNFAVEIDAIVELS